MVRSERRDSTQRNGLLSLSGVVSGEIDALRVKGCPSVNT